MVESETFALLVSIIASALLRLSAGSWLHPAPLFSVVWSVVLAIPVLLVDEFHPAGGAAWLVVGAIVSVSVSSLVSVRPGEARALRFVVPSRFRYLVLVGGPAAVISALIVQRVNGVSLVSLDALIQAAREITVLRYEGDMHTPAVATILLAVTYGSALIAPFVATQFLGVSRFFWLVFPAGGAAAYALLTTARAPFLIASAITAGSWIATRAVSGGGRPRLGVRGIVPLILGSALVAGLFTLVAANRRGGFAESSGEDLIRSVSVYSGGSLPALAQWLPGAPVWPTSLGVETFAGISQFLLMDLSLGGARDDVAQIGGAMSTNVYSAFRVLIEDFSIAGALVFLAVASVLAATGLRRSVTHRSVWGVLAVATWSSFVLFSQTTSIFGFANVCLGFIAASLLILRWVRIENVDTKANIV